MKQFCLITGGASGIGLAFAELLAQKNYNLVLVDKNLNELEKIKQELEQTHKAQVLIFQFNLSTPGVAQTIYNLLEERQIKISILINNAGFGVFGYFHEIEWSRQQEMLRLSVETNTHLMQLFLKDMLSRNSGKILNVASLAAFQPGPLMAVYYASKAYILSLSRAISNEVKDSNVSVTTLCPGVTRTGFQATNGNPDPNYSALSASPKRVAEYGYKAMLKSKSVAIPCFYNRVIANLHRFLPFGTATKISRFIQEHNRS